MQTRLRRLIADERGLETVQYVLMGAVMLALIATVYGALNGSNRLRTAIRVPLDLYAASFGRDVGRRGPCVPPRGGSATVPSGGRCGVVPSHPVLFDARRNVAVVFHPDTGEPLLVRPAPWQRVSVQPAAFTVTLHDPQAHQTIVFSPSNWEVVAFDPVTKAETAYEIVLFQQGDALEVRFVPTPFAPGAFAVVSFQPDAAALVAFGPGPLARVDAVPTRWVATPVLAVPALTVATGAAGRN